MWNNYKVMNYFANMLFVMVAFAVLYIVSLQVITPQVFPLKQISIKAIHGTHSGSGTLQQITREQIELIVHNEISGNFFTVDLAAVRQAFMKLPWVRDMKIQRAWPHGLIVMLEEHTVLARWGNDALVNTHGEVFHAVVDEKLPLFLGSMEKNSQEVTQRYMRFNQLLAPLQQYIAEISVSPRHAWHIRLETGTVLELGRNEVEARLARYASVYNHSIAQLNQQEPLPYMDLRYPNGFAVRMPEATQQVLHKPGERGET